MGGRENHAPEDVRKVGESASTAVLLRAETGKRLRGSQLVFNRLSRRAATLQRKVAKERDRLNELLDRFLRDVAPIEKSVAQRRLDVAFALSETHWRWPLREQQSEVVRHLIVQLLEEASRVIEPDEAAIALHDEWAHDGFFEKQQLRIAGRKRALHEAFRSEFGFDADVPDDGDDSPQGFSRFRERMEEQIRRADAEEIRRLGEHAARNNVSSRERAEQQNLPPKSIREVYLSLAKVLHPDVNVEPEDLARREHDMKRAAAAYREEDVMTLLQLEKRWRARELGSLGDDVLEVYTNALRKLIRKLEADLDSQGFDARYLRIFPLTGLQHGKALEGIDAYADELRGQQQRLDELLALLAACRSKRELARLVADYLDVGGRDVVRGLMEGEIDRE
jgi:hypothetical protein